MRKFLIYLSIILVAISIGFTVYYFVTDNTVISITTSSLYLFEGEIIDDLGLITGDGKDFNDYEVFSSDTSVATYNKTTGQLTAVSGGLATITFRTTNVNFRNMSCQVYVGDGSITNPYYIQNAEQMRAIGGTYTTSSRVISFGLDNSYRLISNINLSDGFHETGYWVPIGSSYEVGYDNNSSMFTTHGASNMFTGTFDGNGYVISGFNINKQEYLAEISNLYGSNYTNIYNESLGLFSKIGTTGKVYNLYIENATVSGQGSLAGTANTVGIVAGMSMGTIERVQITNSTIDVANYEYVGGAVGYMTAWEGQVALDDSTTYYSRGNARLDRVSTNMSIIVSNTDYTSNGALGNVGGLVGENKGSILIYSYTVGQTIVKDVATYGGVVGLVDSYKFAENGNGLYTMTYSGGHVKDTYSVRTLRKIDAEGNLAQAEISGGIIGLLIDYKYTSSEDSDATSSKILGNYYLGEALNGTAGDVGASETNYSGVGAYAYNDSVEGTNSTGMSKLDSEFIDYALNNVTSSELMKSSTYNSFVNADNETIKWKFDSVWFLNDNVNSGYPTLNFSNIILTDDLNLFYIDNEIYTYEDLLGIKADMNNIIMNSITVNPTDQLWVPINMTFYGTFINNDNHVISGLKTTSDIDNATLSEYNTSGIFGTLVAGSNDAYIDGIILTNSVFHGTNVGSIVGNNQGVSISNVTINGGTVVGEFNVGGIAGVNNATIDNATIRMSGEDGAYITSRVNTGDSNVGGIAGSNTGIITNSLVAGATIAVDALAASGSVNAVAVGNVGGVAGSTSGSVNIAYITSSTAKYSEVNSNASKGYVGGVIGSVTGDAEISNVIADIATVGKVASGQSVYVGGVIGRMQDKTKLSNAMVSSSIVEGYHVGGLVGYLVSSESASFTNTSAVVIKLSGTTHVNVTNSYVADSVTLSGTTVGGLVETIVSGTVQYCYTAAHLNGTSTNAGFAINLQAAQTVFGTVVDCYSLATFNSSATNYAIVADKEVIYQTLSFIDNLATDQSKLESGVGVVANYIYIERSGVDNPSTNNPWNSGTIIWDWMTGDSVFETHKPGTGISQSEYNNNDTKNEVFAYRGFDDTSVWTNGVYTLIIESTLAEILESFNARF